MIEEKELAFVKELEKYEKKWVAIANYDSDEEIIVGSGLSLKEAKREAETKGFSDVTYLKVPAFDKVYMPSVTT